MHFDRDIGINSQGDIFYVDTEVLANSKQETGLGCVMHELEALNIEGLPPGGGLSSKYVFFSPQDA